MARVMIVGARHGPIFQSIITALACRALAITDEEPNTCDGLPGSCSTDGLSLLQHSIRIFEQDGRAESTNTNVISHLSRVQHDNHKDVNKMRIGTCIVPAGKGRVKYHSWAASNKTKHGGPAPKKIFEFDAGPWLGMYNPSIVELPASLKQGAATFAMTLRRDLHQCPGVLREAPGKWTAIPKSLDNQPSQLLILDANYCVLSASSLTVSGPVQRLAQDVRLFVDGSNLYASFVLWQYDPDPTGWTGEGIWLAPIKMNKASSSVVLDHSHAVRLGGLEEKNYGLFQYQSKTMALTWVDERSKRPPLIKTKGLPLAAKSGVWHNSANLLPLQDGSGEFLGMMHIHTDPLSGGRRRRPIFLFGHGYKQRFFKLSAKPPYVMTARGEEFCLRNADGMCESVLMVMSMMQTTRDEILVSYGVNDCEVKLASFSISSILKQMSSVPANGRAVGKQTAQVDVIQVPEVNPSLMKLAEMVSPSPIWKYTDYKDSEMATAYEAGLQLQSSLQDMNYESCRSVAGPYGDWPVCNDWVPSSCVVYDFGIANEWNFSDSMAVQHSCEVHAFDPSNGHLKQHKAHRQKHVNFHFLGLSSGDHQTLAANWTDTKHGYGSVTGPLQRLDAIMARLGHRKIDVLKIDCEGCEWESLAAVANGAPEALACVRVLLIEMHFAKRFGGNDDSLANAANVSDHFLMTGWKPWFAVQRGWGADQSEQELFAWKTVGGDSCCYNVGLFNRHFDENKCSVPRTHESR